ncbi:MAG: curli production assembly/transport component CsgG domain protein [Spirochaetia bacterium]|nr:curli production assembly/transport component CsgG domain protein [Spirochaetia bacterium]
MKINFLIIFIILLFSCSSDKKQLVFMDTYPKTVFETVADTISKNLKENIKRVIVLTFITQEGKEHKMGVMFAERLTTELVKQNKVTVLDRLMFKSKLQEKSLTLSGNPDLAYVKQIGDVLNIDAVVVGIVTPYATGYDINCRLIDVKTGLILAAEEGYYSDKVD